MRMNGGGAQRELPAGVASMDALPVRCVALGRLRQRRQPTRQPFPQSPSPQSPGRALTHGLLAHGALVGVARRLVVVWEGHDGGAHAQDHGGVDLAMCVHRNAAALPRLLCCRGGAGGRGGEGDVRLGQEEGKGSTRCLGCDAWGRHGRRSSKPASPNARLFKAQAQAATAHAGSGAPTSACQAQVSNEHCNHGGLLLLHINIPAAGQAGGTGTQHKQAVQSVIFIRRKAAGAH